MAIKLPLKNFHRTKARYPDKIQLLAFAYASIFKDLLGNITSSKAKVLEEPDKYRFYRRLQLLLFNDHFQEQIKIEFIFGQLHIVSCGSRGIEQISFLQIVTVFESRIWIFLFLFTCLIMFCSKHLTGRSLSSILLSIFKVLLEQGGPFPENKEIVN